MSPRLRLGKRAALAAVGATLALCATASAAKPPIAGRDALTGKHVALSQYPRKPVFVNIWGSWCFGCTEEAHTLAAFARAHKDEIAFLGIDTEDSVAGARAFYKRFDTDYPSIWDPKGLLAGAWSRGTPTTLVFDRRHVYVTRIEGSASLAQLKAALKRAIRR